MFLFLSKLLPLFFYPLGLSCLLLLIALVLVWRKPRFAALSIVLALSVLLAGSNAWVANQLAQSLEWQYIPTFELPQADAIVVLGGAIKPESPPRPWVDVSEAGDRPIHGAQLYREGKAPFIILSGGRIDWKDGGPPESADMAKLVEALGVPATAILQDPTSLNTYENAVNVRQILQERNLKRVLLVTSAMHMPRSLKIFQKLGIEVFPAPTDFLVTEQNIQESWKTTEGLVLGLLPDAEQLQQTTRALKEYVGLLYYRLKGWL